MPDIFERVKRDIEKEIGRHRAGLSLGLVSMGMYHGSFIGGMFFSGGTMILMNVDPLHVILDEQPDEVVIAYVYHILLHEYLHSLGFLNERQCRVITLEVSKNVFQDPKHPIVILATKGIGAYFSNLPLIYAPPNYDPQKGWQIDRVKEFDKESFRYFG
ncbi:MAG: hypothetical protein HWN66_08855 [Candidatus Helarchaeota archaeon]|nr:hypothetical protein [Candidatus Helarchaeota archaeon]